MSDQEPFYKCKFNLSYQSTKKSSFPKLGVVKSGVSISAFTVAISLVSPLNKNINTLENDFIRKIFK